MQRRNGELGTKPLLVKIAPDLSESEIEGIVEICLSHQIVGIIATNTTTGREGLKTPNAANFGEGGLSGRPLPRISNHVIALVRKHSKGRMPIIGVGGIFTAEDAFEKIAAGACLLEAYTGFVYRGVSFAWEINLGLAEILENRGFRTLEEAIGTSGTA